MTAEIAAEYEVMLCVGDTTFLDYDGIVAKREGYGPIGKGGNGLILHSALAIVPETGQALGLLWQKIWHREQKPKPAKDETPEQKKKRQAEARNEARKRPFAEKESYRWVEAMENVESLVSKSTKVIHIFDREGDITEVFDKVRQLEHTGLVVRAAQNRSLDQESERLWAKLTAEAVGLRTEIQIPETGKRAARQAKLEVRFCQVNLRTPYRFTDREPLKVYAVYAQEVEAPEGETPVEWMLITTEAVTDALLAAEILRWYSYRWHIEEYHKILKSGCKAEQYRLAADGMTSLLGFLSIIAVELLQLTYLHRTKPTALAIEILSPLQLKVLKTTSKVKLPKELNVSWAISAIARLGGYLEHRRGPIGIQVLWRGLSKLHTLCQGWELASST